MQLKEIQTILLSVNRSLEKQKKDTKEIRTEMTIKNYFSKTRKIGKFEFIGTLVCYVGASYLITNFEQIESPLMQLLDLICILLLLSIPVISQKSMKTMNTMKISETYRSEIHEVYTRKKLKFQKFQLLNVFLGFVLMVSILPVLAVIKGNELNSLDHFWTLVVPIGVLVFAGYSYTVLNFYNKTLNEAEKIIIVLKVKN